MQRLWFEPDTLRLDYKSCIVVCHLQSKACSCRVRVTVYLVNDERQVRIRGIRGQIQREQQLNPVSVILRYGYLIISSDSSSYFIYSALELPSHLDRKSVV